MSKPTPEQFGYYNAISFDEESGWMIEEGEERYYEALKQYEEQTTKKKISMKFCVIPTLSNPELMREGEMIFVLAQHYLRNEKYRNYVKQLKSEGFWIILDNGAGDYETVTPQILLEATLDLMPNEIIPLDTIFDAETTLGDLNKFIEMMEEAEIIDKVDIFAVPQGKTKEDWLFCYKQMLANPNVKTIGFSKIGVPYAFGMHKDDQGIMEGRHACYDELMAADLIQKPIHCLGAGDPREFLKYKNNPLMRSTDSCFSVWAGMCGVLWDEGNFVRHKTPKDYFLQKIDEGEIEYAKRNIAFLRTIVTNTIDNE